MLVVVWTCRVSLDVTFNRKGETSGWVLEVMR